MSDEEWLSKLRSEVNKLKVDDETTDELTDEENGNKTNIDSSEKNNIEELENLEFEKTETKELESSEEKEIPVMEISDEKDYPEFEKPIDDELSTDKEIPTFEPEEKKEIQDLDEENELAEFDKEEEKDISKEEIPVFKTEEPIEISEFDKSDEKEESLEEIPTYKTEEPMEISEFDKEEDKEIQTIEQEISKEDEELPEFEKVHVEKTQIQQTADMCRALVDEVGKTILGKRETLELVTVSILANGHVLFEDLPGLAKTLMANTFSSALGCKFKRIQFTPDLLPSDITGTYIFDVKNSEFKFNQGPIFTNILLADEVNRAPPKTQAALLEAMQEKQVTLEGTTHELTTPFIVIATQNPIEYEGTYQLPEAQLDRFLMKLSIGYPSDEVEAQILFNRQQRKKDKVDVKIITNPETVEEMQKTIEQVHVDPNLIRYMVAIIRATRDDPRVQVGSSPRGSQALFKLSRAIATLRGRDFVTPDDIKQIVIPALSHRLILKPEPRIRGIKPEDVLAKILDEVQIPIPNR